MAVAAAEGVVQGLAHTEKYAQSLRVIRSLGRVVCHSTAEAPRDAHEYTREAWQDFVTGIQENLTTDEELGEYLEFNPVRTYTITEGHAVDDNGRPMVDIIGTGVDYSREAAALDSRMHTQLDRDLNDLFTAEQVDKLAEGELYAAVSLDPKDAMARDGRAFWEKLGYREGMAVLQVYYRKDEQTLLGGAYSIKKSDKAALRQVLAHYGVHVPENVPADDYIRQAIRRTVPYEHFEQFGPDFQTAYARATGQRAGKISVTKHLANHEPLVRMYFDTYVTELARATYSGINNEVMASLAIALLQNPDAFEPQERQQLLRIANGTTFSDGDGRFMEGAIRYAVVEELRKLLLVSGRPAEGYAAVTTLAAGPHAPATMAAVLNARAAHHIQTGAEAGRSYGGCAAARMGARKKAADQAYGAGDDDVTKGPQDLFGGKSEESADDSEGNEACDYVFDGCYCCPYTSDGDRLGGAPLMVLVIKDEHGVARCTRSGCGAAMDDNGVTLSYGGIYKKAQAKQATAPSAGALALFRIPATPQAA